MYILWVETGQSRYLFLSALSRLDRPPTDFSESSRGWSELSGVEFALEEEADGFAGLVGDWGSDVPAVRAELVQLLDWWVDVASESGDHHAAVDLDCLVFVRGRVRPRPGDTIKRFVVTGGDLSSATGQRPLLSGGVFCPAECSLHDSESESRTRRR